jgi:1-phosphofructokinase
MYYCVNASKRLELRLMIMTVTLNPCIDKTLTIASFTHGGMNRVIHERQDIAGKGINVSAALAGLGCESVCTGFNYADNGVLVMEYLDGLGIAYNFISVPGTVRTNIKLFEQDTQVMTEINQSGAYVSPGSVEALLAFIKKEQPEWLVLSGSRPQGIAADIYARILEQSAGYTILDTEGEALRLGLSCVKKPFLIKPNLYELENAFNVHLPTHRDISEFCNGLLGGGLVYVCVSMGKDGALLIGAEGTFFAEAPDIPVRGTQGAGDSMVAGFLWGLAQNLGAGELLRCAVAAASASVVREGTLLCEGEGFTKMLKLVRVLI